MADYTVAVVGTGPDPENPSAEGYAMGYRHAEAYRNDERCELVACADIVPENAEAFAAEFDLPSGGIFEDYNRMLAEAEPDIVSVCVPPAIHEQVVVDCVRSGAVEAVHCEKPMGHTFAGAKRQAQEAWRAGVQLTYNRQRRFGTVFTEAKRLLDEGAIGELERVEIGWGDFLDTGAHTVDLATMFNDEHAAEWVIAGLDYRTEDVRFGAHQENQMFAHWEYENGVAGLAATGESDMVGATMRVRGSEGELVIDPDDGEMLELHAGGEVEAVDVGGENVHGTPADKGRFGSVLQDRSVDEVVSCLDANREPVISARRGLNTAELLFGGYESVRRRGRVEFPLDIEDNPLEAMVEGGDLNPEPRE